MKIESLQHLIEFNPSKDPQNLIGDRFLCRHGTLLISGPSGIGKSTFVLQMVSHFALGRTFLGIRPQKPMKVMYVQAENDTGDLSEIVHGLEDGIGFSRADPMFKILEDNLMIVNEDSLTGEAFVDALGKLALKESPDLIVIDPLLSYIGGDINQQEVVSRFMRGGINPMLKRVNAGCICVHHMGKTNTKNPYAALGSSELINHARAVINMHEAPKSAEYDVEFSATKRGNRIGVTDVHGFPTRQFCVKYGDTRYQSFERVDAPVQSASGGGKALSRQMRILGYADKSMSKKQVIDLVVSHEGVSVKTATRDYAKLFAA